MGVDILQMGYKDEGLPIDATPPQDAYYGGMPATIGAGGTKLLKSEQGEFIGVFKNSSYEDNLNGASVIIRGGKLQLINGSNQIDTVVNGVTVEGQPWTGSPSVGDYLFVNGSGLWANSGTLNWEKAIVTAVTATTIEAYFFDAR